VVFLEEESEIISNIIAKMKKKIILSLIILASLFAIIKGSEKILILKIEEKNEVVNNSWSNLYVKNRNVNLFIEDLNYNQKFISSDTLNHILRQHKNLKECSIDYVELEYFINKSINKILNDSLVENNLKIKLEQKIVELNELVSIYNIEVKDYNNLIRAFPINLYSYKKYKTKEYFEITYGIENINPKTKYDEIPNWMLEMEKGKE